MPLPAAASVALPFLSGLLGGGSQTTVTTQTTLAADVSPNIQVVIDGGASSGSQSGVDAQGSATATPTFSQTSGLPQQFGGLGSLFGGGAVPSGFAGDFNGQSALGLAALQSPQPNSILKDPVVLIGGAVAAFIAFRMIARK